MSEQAEKFLAQWEFEHIANSDIVARADREDQALGDIGRDSPRLVLVSNLRRIAGRSACRALTDPARQIITTK